jgi:hypothetical protein
MHQGRFAGPVNTINRYEHAEISLGFRDFKPATDMNLASEPFR